MKKAIAKIRVDYVMDRIDGRFVRAYTVTAAGVPDAIGGNVELHIRNPAFFSFFKPGEEFCVTFEPSVAMAPEAPEPDDATPVDAG